MMETAYALGTAALSQPDAGFVTALGGVDATEEVFVDRLRAGDDDAFAELVRAQTPRLFAAARRLLHNDDDAGDAVQEAFMAAFKSIDRFQGAARLSTWLHRIVINAALMKLRSSSRRPEESIEDLLPRFDADGNWATEVHSWGATADDLLQRRETRALVRRCIDCLPDTYRTVLVLRDIEDLDTEEVADALDITPNATKIRLHRARQALRTLLERELPGHEQGACSSVAM